MHSVDDLVTVFFGVLIGILLLLFMSYIVISLEDISAFREETILRGRLDTGIRVYSTMIDTAATDSVYGKTWRHRK